MKEIWQRFWTAGLSFLILLLVLKIGITAFAPAMIALCIAALHEYVGMLRNQDIDVRMGSLMVFGVALMVASIPPLEYLPWWHPYPPWPGGSWREVVIGIYLFYLLIIELASPGERPLERVVYSIFGLMYIPWLLGYFLMLRQTPNEDFGYGYLLLPLIASFATDTGGFFFGKFFGRRKLAPEISPAKTVEGAVGGLIFSFIFVFWVGSILERYNYIPKTNIYDTLLFSLLVSSAAQLGDLAESLLKRSVGAKDSGRFLPGHGGLLDRLDSVLFAVPVTYLYLNIVVLQ